MDSWPRPTPGQVRRLVEELEEAGLPLDGTQPWHALAIEEIAYAMRPMVHERKVPSYGAFVEPTTDPGTWSQATGLGLRHGPLGQKGADGARRYADGIASWLLRRTDGHDEFVLLERQAGSERDLVVLAEALGGVVVQRHPAGKVRVAGPFGVYRWAGLGWHHEPQVDELVAALVEDCRGDQDVLENLLEFAVHDLGARGIGATLVVGPDMALEKHLEVRHSTPPAISITDPISLAPLRHALAQTDGAALFDRSGTLRQIGVRLVPSLAAELEVDGFRGMRHTSARRYSHDDPHATVVVVSEDGPVTVFRGGDTVGTMESPEDDETEPS
jgi:hypothetical protein